MADRGGGRGRCGNGEEQRLGGAGRQHSAPVQHGLHGVPRQQPRQGCSQHGRPGSWTGQPPRGLPPLPECHGGQGHERRVKGYVVAVRGVAAGSQHRPRGEQPGRQERLRPARGAPAAQCPRCQGKQGQDEHHRRVAEQARRPPIPIAKERQTHVLRQPRQRLGARLRLAVVPVHGVDLCPVRQVPQERPCGQHAGQAGRHAGGIPKGAPPSLGGWKGNPECREGDRDQVDAQAPGDRRKPQKGAARGHPPGTPARPGHRLLPADEAPEGGHGQKGGGRVQEGHAAEEEVRVVQRQQERPGGGDPRTERPAQRRVQQGCGGKTARHRDQPAGNGARPQHEKDRCLNGVDER